MTNHAKPVRSTDHSDGSSALHQSAFARIGSARQVCAVRRRHAAATWRTRDSCTHRSTQRRRPNLVLASDYISKLHQTRGGDPMDMVLADMSKPRDETRVHRKAMKARDGAAPAKRTLRLDWSNDTAERDDNCAERAAIFSCTSCRAPDRDCGKCGGYHRITHPCSCASEFSRRSRRPFDEYGPVRKMARSAGALVA